MKHAWVGLAAGLVLLIGVGPAHTGTIAGKVEAKPAKFRKDAVVYVEGVEGETFVVPEDPAVMDQKNLTFTPHVLPVVKGTTVQFRNADEVLHNVFTPDKCAGKFNLGSWPKGQSREYTFESAGCQAVMLCNVHPEMEAYVLVLENPYYAVTDKEGEFVIPDVPPGEYTLQVWHEKLKAEPQSVVVADADTVSVAFILKR